MTNVGLAEGDYVAGPIFPEGHAEALVDADVLVLWRCWAQHQLKEAPEPRSDHEKAAYERFVQGGVQARLYTVTHGTSRTRIVQLETCNRTADPQHCILALHDALTPELLITVPQSHLHMLQVQPELLQQSSLHARAVLQRIQAEVANGIRQPLAAGAVAGPASASKPLHNGSAVLTEVPVAKLTPGAGPASQCANKGKGRGAPAPAEPPPAPQSSPHAASGAAPATAARPAAAGSPAGPGEEQATHRQVERVVTLLTRNLPASGGAELPASAAAPADAAAPGSSRREPSSPAGAAGGTGVRANSRHTPTAAAMASQDAAGPSSHRSSKRPAAAAGGAAEAKDAAPASLRASKRRLSLAATAAAAGNSVAAGLSGSPSTHPTSSSPVPEPRQAPAAPAAAPAGSGGNAATNTRQRQGSLRTSRLGAATIAVAVEADKQPVPSVPSVHQDSQPRTTDDGAGPGSSKGKRKAAVAVPEQEAVPPQQASPGKRARAGARPLAGVAKVPAPPEPPAPPAPPAPRAPPTQAAAVPAVGVQAAGVADAGMAAVQPGRQVLVPLSLWPSWRPGEGEVRPACGFRGVVLKRYAKRGSASVRVYSVHVGGRRAVQTVEWPVKQLALWLQPVSENLTQDEYTLQLFAGKR